MPWIVLEPVMHGCKKLSQKVVHYILLWTTLPNFCIKDQHYFWQNAHYTIRQYVLGQTREKKKIVNLLDCFRDQNWQHLG